MEDLNSIQAVVLFKDGKLYDEHIRNQYIELNDLDNLSKALDRLKCIVSEITEVLLNDVFNLIKKNLNDKLCLNLINSFLKCITKKYYTRRCTLLDYHIQLVELVDGNINLLIAILKHIYEIKSKIIFDDKFDEIVLLVLCIGKRGFKLSNTYLLPKLPKATLIIFMDKIFDKNDELNKLHPTYSVKSKQHYVKLNIVLTFEILYRRTRVWNPRLLNCILTENNQPNINILLECIIARRIESIQDIFIVLYQTTKEQSLLSIFMIMYHYVERCPHQPDVQKCLDHLLSYTKEEHFILRLYAQQIILKIYESYENSRETSNFEKLNSYYINMVNDIRTEMDRKELSNEIIDKYKKIIEYHTVDAAKIFGFDVPVNSHLFKGGKYFEIINNEELYRYEDYIFS